MEHNNIGLAMYTVHEHVAKDMHSTFQKLAEQGYRGIEFYGEQRDFDTAKVREALADSGLVFTGWHVEWANLQEDTYADTVRILHETGCPLAIIPCLGGKWEIGHGPKDENRDTWLRYFEKIEVIRRKLEIDGIRCGYHNHEHEFQLSYDGKLLFDFIFDNLSEKMIIEFDSGNCIEGGDDPLRVLRKYHDREMILHLKPYSKTNGFDTVLGDPDDANDWASILDPANKEYLWMLVESENAVLDEYENSRRCMEGLQRYLPQF